MSGLQNWQLKRVTDTEDYVLLYGVVLCRSIYVYYGVPEAGRWFNDVFDLEDCFIINSGNAERALRIIAARDC